MGGEIKCDTLIGGLRRVYHVRYIDITMFVHRKIHLSGFSTIFCVFHMPCIRLN